MLALVFIAIYAAFDWASPRLQDLVIVKFGFVPGRLTVSLWPAEAIKLLIRARTDPAAAEQVAAMRDLHALSGGAKPWTLLTYAFLHGSWVHVLLNTVWLVAVGPPVARRFGTARFLIFMAVTAIISALAQWASAPMEFAPLIGASGADLGLMGAVTRFMFQPGAPLSASAFTGNETVETIPAATSRRGADRPPGANLPLRLARYEFCIWRIRTAARLVGHARGLGRPCRRICRRHCPHSGPKCSAVRASLDVSSRKRVPVALLQVDPDTSR